ncbi:MAG: hypothetical protein DRR00_13190 [Candidatus Parabeggiatoa sp. nov. 3]|nr:MAG: hypothetical protein DRR00_13190 [Gammaproteobacteria bacterium]RKZ61551.1 MAG: hypothetical protein DRQ99_20235 [Gammaproteobacteria bacterium]
MQSLNPDYYIIKKVSGTHSFLALILYFIKKIEAASKINSTKAANRSSLSSGEHAGSPLQMPFIF